MKSTDAFRFTYTRICLWYMSRIVDKCPHMRNASYEYRIPWLRARLRVPSHGHRKTELENGIGKVEWWGQPIGIVPNI